MTQSPLALKLCSANRTLRVAVAAALFATCASPEAGATTIVPLPSPPAYGQEVRFYLGTTEYPQFMPANRFVRSGTSIVVDFDFVTHDFGPSDPAFGYMAVPVGQLLPGNYTIQARLFDMDQPSAAPQSVKATLAVAPPQAWGVFPVPSAPGAWEAASLLVNSAVYFDPSTLRMTQSGNAIRIDFDYASNAPVGGPIPPGFVSYAALGIEGLAPGAYHVDTYARALPDGTSTQVFTLDLNIGTAMPVIEYYQAQLGHYFLSGGPGEVKLLDAGGQGGWQRTGQNFKAWLRQVDAPANAHPVCRFYAYGPNSHFFTGNDGECQYLKRLEQSQRADAAAAGTPFLGWGYEGIGFWALVPQDGQCPADSDPVYRVYNNRAAEDDSNHRFMLKADLLSSMSTWNDEGVQFCSPR